MEMKLLKTMFYPVDVDAKIIFIDPMKRERDIANKWGRGDNPCNGLRGDRLLKHKCYESFQRKATVTKETLLSEWKVETTHGGTLWKGAAMEIVKVIEACEPNAALAAIKKLRTNCQGMAISVYYERAIKDIKVLLSQQAQLV